MDPYLFKTVIESVKEMDEIQLEDLVAALRHHVIIPNFWMKMHVDYIAKNSVDVESYKTFCLLMNYFPKKGAFDVHHDINRAINTFFMLGNDGEWCNKDHEYNEGESEEEESEEEESKEEESEEEV